MGLCSAYMLPKDTSFEYPFGTLNLPGPESPRAAGDGNLDMRTGKEHIVVVQYPRSLLRSSEVWEAYKDENQSSPVRNTMTFQCCETKWSKGAMGRNLGYQREEGKLQLHSKGTTVWSSSIGISLRLSARIYTGTLVSSIQYDQGFACTG